MDRVWDTSKYHPKPFVTLCQVNVIQGQEVKKWHLKLWVWVVWYMFLGQIFVKNAKNDPRTIFELKNGTIFFKSGNCRCPCKWSKKWPFRHSKRQNSAVFFKTSTWNVVNLFIDKCSLTYIPVFENTKNFSENFGNKQFLMTIFP